MHFVFFAGTCCYSTPLILLSLIFQDVVNNSGSPDSTIEPTFLSDLQTLCPATGDNNTLASFSIESPKTGSTTIISRSCRIIAGFYSLIKNFIADARTKSVVDTYINSQITFFQDFVTSMIRMGNISPLTGTDGQILTNCRVVN
jgi:peroxidase